MMSLAIDNAHQGLPGSSTAISSTAISSTAISSTAILSTAVSSTLGSSNPVSSTNKYLDFKVRLASIHYFLVPSQ